MEDKVLKKKMYTQIEKWESSGKSQASYCRSIGIKPSKFEYCLKKYRKESTLELSDTSESFIPISVTPESTTLVVNTPNIQITYPNGVKLECSTLEDSSQLRTLQTLMD